MYEEENENRQGDLYTNGNSDNRDSISRPSYYRDDIYAPLEYTPSVENSASQTADSSAGNTHTTDTSVRTGKKRFRKTGGFIHARRWRYVGAAALVLLMAMAGGYVGTRLAADSIVDRAAEQMALNMEGYLEQAGATVLYRNVSTTTESNTASSSMDVAAVTKAVQDSVVEISTEVISYYNSWWGQIGQEISQGAGSGVIISDDGYILTCHHVVADANTIRIALRNGEVYDAVLVGSSEENDLAVLKIDAQGLSPAVLGNSSDLVVGSAVIALGNPLGSLAGTMTAGYISALERELTIDGSTYTLLQTDAAINGGNSGGGLFNANGELVGIVSAKATSIGVEGLGFALPIDDLKQDIEGIISYGYPTSNVSLGIISVNVTDDRTAIGYDVDTYGIYIAYVVEGSNAEYAGLQVGDRIISMDGKEITENEQVAEIVSTKQDGDTLEIVLSRNGKELTIPVVMYAVVPDGDTRMEV